ncbi:MULTISPECIES: DNA-3-methyladenine glycosylase I [unclassified Leptolyngbya]|uniref:DNA-3-methyladenine glycosylase I n=1 Tax=unclassified Leptolyngbya TaxID=2650499 RepID=UPI001685746D|nr:MULTISPECIES: DNA-3-methyladenine glycosylase I [unclassified Leptolyngbya]MBD1910310.1 DNA-3-methyladenine glycosylase I [Leptolyngbya sp. FACHB-8]MBD2155778.1 DNA-3-methyladenine glycosylase I [Leptolyngbya sp. FACHB-16]
MPLTRCAWVTSDPLYLDYHDHEWGVPVHDDTRLFEFLILEGAQAGLSWLTVLRKREAYREAFDGFDVEAIAHYDDAKIATLLTNASIIRNRLKVEAAVRNARAVLKIRQEFGSLDRYLWQFVDGQPIVNAWKSIAEVPAETPESRAMSKDLRKRGCNFVGPTICYALMQACGFVNDHTTDCFRYLEMKS